MISARTKAALQQAKARGVKLGGPNLAAIKGQGATANKARAARHAANVVPVIRELERDGFVSLREIATVLTRRGVRTPRGFTEWKAATVSRVMKHALKHTPEVRP